eukprot:m.240396 g.240396  ORF g.240396 m.240396 type:complete len:241 (-) comp15013_c0_seq1:120-842(-)
MTTATTSTSTPSPLTPARLGADINNMEQLNEEKEIWKRLTNEQKMQLLGLEVTSQEREAIAQTLADSNRLAYFAYWYQWAAMISKSFVLLLGVAIPVLISLQDSTSDQRQVEALKFSAIALSAFSTLLIGIEGYYKFTERGQKMNSAAIKIGHHFLQFRGLTGKLFGPPEEDDSEPMIIPNLSSIPIGVLKAIVAERENEEEPEEPWEKHTGASYKKYIQVTSKILKQGFTARDAVFVEE